ncbi:hypothetical protein ABPG72_006429 [Tetrahymena utriculariae]
MDQLILEDTEDENNDIDVYDPQLLQIYLGKKKKKFKNIKPSKDFFYIQIIIFIMLIQSFFTLNYILTKQTIDEQVAVIKEYNYTSHITDYFLLSNNALIERVLQVISNLQEQPILTQKIKISQDVQTLNNGNTKEHTQNSQNSIDNYKTVYNSIIFNDPCPIIDSYLTYSLPECQSFSNSLLKDGVITSKFKIQKFQMIE